MGSRLHGVLKKLKSLVTVTASGFAVFSGISIYRGDEKFFQQYLIPASRLLPPETSHRMAILACKYNIFPRHKSLDDGPRLKTKLLNFILDNPVGIAAGFDKHGEVPDKLLENGFGFVEIGSVTPLPQEGNDKPRVFRLEEDMAVINRYGFNSDGHEVVFERLSNLRKTGFSGILGVNLGKNKTSEDPVEDYVKGVQLFGPIADYLVVNVSSPNTPGLRTMQHKDILYNLLKATLEARNALAPQKPPILLKLAPDLSHDELKDVAQTISKKECHIDGLIISNTTISRENLQSEAKNEAGGLSGKPLTQKSTKMVAQMHKLTKGKVPIIGVGGIFTGQDAFEKILAGASAVQLYTSFIYFGPFVVSQIKKDLEELLQQNGYANVNEAVGKGVNQFLD